MIVSFTKALLELPRLSKRVLVYVVDFNLCVISVWLAYYLRLGIFVSFSRQVTWVVLAAVLFAMPIFAVSGLYREIFRYSGLRAILTVCRAMLLYGVFFATIFTFNAIEGVPRTVGLIQPILLTILVGASRVLAPLLLGRGDLHSSKMKPLPRALIYGAGKAGRELAVAIANSDDLRVVGFLDDDESLHGNLMNGLPVYCPADAGSLLNKMSITDVLLALPNASRQRRSNIIKGFGNYKVAVRSLPSFTDLLIGKISLNDVHELDIDDLLGREPVKPNDYLININTHGKTVLVTGAGGSIGSELCRQILSSKPKRILLVEMNEFALYQIHKELLAMMASGVPISGGIQKDSANVVEFSLHPKELGVSEVEVIPLLGSVCDEVRMLRIMNTWKPHTVYHAAAYKHVPMVEHNPVEGVRNNIWGTLVCAEAAQRSNVENFVLISTDKAVRPTNIMGATKRIAELILQALASVDPLVLTDKDGLGKRTIFSIVRFGNVLDSSGSVVPIFRDQVKNGGPVTVTHLEITRYFMTIPEAAQLVIQAGAMGRGGDVFVLDMGQPVKIIDLARRVIKLSGLSVRDDLNPDGDIEISITGLRPGEKLYEELLIGDNPEATLHPRIMKANEQCIKWQQLEEKLQAISVATKTNDVMGIRAILQQLVEGYEPVSEVVDWVSSAGEGTVSRAKHLQK